VTRLSRNRGFRRALLGRTDDLGTPGEGARSHVVISAAALLVLLLATAAQARVHRSQGWAETQFTKAEGQRETLNGHNEQARTRREYETAIASYRRIVLEAPTSSKADASAFAVAELTAEMGRHFKDDIALYSAVREYKYLRREYPGSKHRIEALLAIGEIYKNDLGDDSEARAAFEELIRRYPRSKLVKEAQAELAASTQQASAGKDQNADETEDAQDNDSDASEQPGKPPRAIGRRMVARKNLYALKMSSTGRCPTTPA